MAYVGNQTTNSFTSMAKQDITGNGGASYTLSHAVANEQEIEVFVNNVRQEGGVGKAYTVSGTALTMTGNVTSSDTFYVVFQGKAVGTIVTPDASVSTAKIIDGSVTKAKIGATELDLATIKDSTGTNTAMTIDSTGRVLQPAKPFFHVSESNRTGGTGLTGQIAFDTVVTDIGGNYNNAGFFKAPVAGVYHFDFSAIGAGSNTGAGLPSAAVNDVYLQKATSDDFSSGLYTFGSAYAYLAVSDDDGGTDSSNYYPVINISMTVYLAANDRVRVFVQTNYIFASSETKYDPHFSGYLIG